MNKKELKSMVKKYNYDIELIRLGARTVDDKNFDAHYDMLLELQD